MTTWRRAFSGSVAEIVATARWVDGIAAEQALPADVTLAIQICVDELLANIDRNGGEHPRIELTLVRLPDHIELAIEDVGKPFDVAASTPHRIEGPLEEVQTGGLGIQLIHSFASRL